MIPLILFLLLSETTCDDPIQKCCRNGEELHSNGRDCVRRSGHQIQIMEDGETIDAGNLSQLKLQNLYWLPLSVLNKLPPQNLFVQYGNTNLCSFEYFILLNTNNSDRYRITDNYTLIVSFTYIDGNTFNVDFENTEYCLDSLSGPSDAHAFRLCLDGKNNVTSLRKCCKFGQRIQLIQNVVTCKDAENSTWLLHDSIFRSYFSNTTVTDVMDGSKNLCSSGELKIVQPNEASKYITESLDSLLDEYDVENYKCFDSFFDAFTENETIGFCHHTNKTLRAYLLVFRHFSALAATALAVGLIILGCRSDIRKTIHGKSLLCHILSLSIGHVLHTLSQYDYEWDFETLLLSLNFFVMSSVLWLNAICFNIARGLGVPLEARKYRNRWAAFAWYNLYVWGGSSLHTVLLATQPWEEYDDRDILSYVYHTKTVFNPYEWRNSLNLKALFFGYGPVCTLLIINFYFLITAVLKIRKMERDTSLLYRRLSVRINNKKKSLKYVRLLLTTGVGETAAEIAALASRFPPTYDYDGSRLMDDSIWIMWLAYKEALFRILAALCELVRAFSVLALCCANDSGVFRRIRAGSRTLRRSVARCSGQNDKDRESGTCTGDV